MSVVSGSAIVAIGLDRIDDLGAWARTQGLETVMVVSGAVLLNRGANALLRQYLRRVGARAERVAEPKRAQAAADRRRMQALVQASSWVITALITLVAATLVATRFGVPLATVVPPATVAGVAVGFGAQRVVQDVLSGFFLLSERQLSVGDTVRVASPGSTTGVKGLVEEVTLRVTRLRTVQGEVVFIPNGEIRQLINLSMDWAQLVVDVPLRAVEEVNAAIAQLKIVVAAMVADEHWQELLLEAPRVLGVQAIEVGAVRVRVVARVRAADQDDAGLEMRLRITSGLAEAGIATAGPLLIPTVAT